jgi:glycosyltransferase involved in cell wall biosynthesis
MHALNVTVKGETMRTLIIATSSKAKNADDEIASGLRPRLEYVELGKYLNSPYVDYNRDSLHYHPLIRRMEERLRLDVFWAQVLAHRINAERYDVVFSMSERIGIPLAHILHRNIRHYVIMHHPMSPRKLKLIKTLKTQNNLAKLLPLSDAETRALKGQLRDNAGRVETLHYAIDTEYYNIPENNGPKEKGGFILSLGLSNRDYPTLLKAMSCLPDVPCEISGTSAWVKHNAGFEGHSIPKNVSIVDYDHPSVIRDAYARSGFVVIPLNATTTQWSAGSASVLQPQAMGKPVIATHIPGLSDYVIDGETGFLVKGNDAQAMKDAIEYLWRNPEKAAVMGENAREWVRKNYSYDKWLNSVCNIVTQVEVPV